MQKQCDFRCLIVNLGEGKKENSKQVHIIDENNQIERTKIKKEEIENAIMQHNKKYFSKVLQLKVHNDKIY